MFAMLGSLKYLDGYDREDKEAEEEEVSRCQAISVMKYSLDNDLYSRAVWRVGDLKIWVIASVDGKHIWGVRALNHQILKGLCHSEVGDV